MNKHLTQIITNISLEPDFSLLDDDFKKLISYKEKEDLKSLQVKASKKLESLSVKVVEIPVKPKENKATPELKEFGILATRVILYLLGQNIKPTNKLVIEIISQKIDISKLSKTTIETYCSSIKKIIKDEKYTDKILSGEMSVPDAYRGI